MPGPGASASTAASGCGSPPSAASPPVASSGPGSSTAGLAGSAGSLPSEYGETSTWPSSVFDILTRTLRGGRRMPRAHISCESAWSIFISWTFMCFLANSRIMLIARIERRLSGESRTLPRGIV